MSSPTKMDMSAVRAEEERLVQALINRGLITRAEADEVRQQRGEPEAGPRELLGQLVKRGYLTTTQAQRCLANLEALAHQPIPGFQLLEKLGQGSMGEVYKARQLSMDRLVAVKILSPKLAANPGYIQRLVREARVAAKLSSNNIVQAIDVGSVGSLHYFVMEYVEGRTIKQELETGKVYGEREAVEIILQVAQALEHAHRRQLIHRDVKPANIILTTDGMVKLADLGLARQVEDQELDKVEKGLVIGTPYYIAPELIRGPVEADIRSDIYSLGATLYHMVTGRPPFPGRKTTEVLRAHLTQPLTPPDHLNTALSAGLGEVVELMMAKERDQRYANPAELIIDLECLLRGEPPRLARHRSQYSALAQLAAGEVADDEDEVECVPFDRPAPRSALWLIVLAVLLGFSTLLNIVLLLL
jgi:serine/threonine-protein kinase